MEKLKQDLMDRGASLVGFAQIEGLYNMDESASGAEPRPMPPMGVSIALAIPREVVLGIRERPTPAYENAYHILNDKLDALATYCAKALQQLGYFALPQTVAAVEEFGVYTTRMPHKTVAVQAGLGWIGKSALLVTPQYGSAVRLTSVLTDAPLAAGSPIDNRCGACMRCHDACPGHAITGRLWDATHERDWVFDALACRKAARERAWNELHHQITLCGKCIEICPYTQRYLHA